MPDITITDPQPIRFDDCAAGAQHEPSEVAEGDAPRPWREIFVAWQLSVVPDGGQPRTLTRPIEPSVELFVPWQFAGVTERSPGPQG